MNKKPSLYVKFLIFLLFSLSSCASGCATINISNTVEEKIPRHSFVQVRQFVKLEGCGLDKETGKEKCQTAEMRYVSSGAYVFHSEVEQATSYIVTAGHSCQNSLPSSQNVDGFRIVNKGSRFIVVGLNGDQ